MLEPYYQNKNEIVDLFYAITNSQGWIKTTKNAVTVRIEPLQQAGHRAAQKQLCKKLTAMGAQIPSGKFLVVEVGESPFNNVQKNRHFIYFYRYLNIYGYSFINSLFAGFRVRYAIV